MNEVAFAAYLLETLLHDVFHSKRRMARELDVTLRTLQLNMRARESAKGANRATLWAVCYCCKHGIDIQEIYNRFVATKKGGLFQTIEHCRKAIFQIITKMNVGASKQCSCAFCRKRCKRHGYNFSGEKGCCHLAFRMLSFCYRHAVSLTACI